ncbi:hypothetical protein PGT21_023257 [Puccinia graminis f. sp. tritici]|uniref:Uncharacterized protein n=1 Tax=Puccinia graminis f. sp. tritici TaxID=56615 RepID=A0A5B0NGM2_PUCGR|nr:hypothetical protein PGT21_023257 [Puccinia graminis f. sp. tritici]
MIPTPKKDNPHKEKKERTILKEDLTENDDDEDARIREDKTDADGPIDHVMIPEWDDDEQAEQDAQQASRTHQQTLRALDPDLARPPRRHHHTGR